MRYEAAWLAVYLYFMDGNNRAYDILLFKYFPEKRIGLGITIIKVNNINIIIIFIYILHFL